MKKAAREQAQAETGVVIISQKMSLTKGRNQRRRHQRAWQGIQITSIFDSGRILASLYDTPIVVGCISGKCVVCSLPQVQLSESGTGLLHRIHSIRKEAIKAS